VVEVLTTASFREALLGQAGVPDHESLGRTLADLAAAQTRLQSLDDDYYVRGALAEGRYRSVKAKLEREIDRLHASADAATKRRVALDPDPRASWAVADFQRRRELVRLVVERVRSCPDDQAWGALTPLVSGLTSSLGKDGSPRQSRRVSPSTATFHPVLRSSRKPIRFWDAAWSRSRSAMRSSAAP
jgi:hypothetical protein